MWLRIGDDEDGSGRRLLGLDLHPEGCPKKGSPCHNKATVSGYPARATSCVADEPVSLSPPLQPHCPLASWESPYRLPMPFQENGPFVLPELTGVCRARVGFSKLRLISECLVATNY